MIEAAKSEIQNKMLFAAEYIFAIEGYDKASLRKITKKAQVNLAAVNYHFGEKEALYCEVIRRRLREINQTRLANLTRAEQSAGDRPVPLALLMDLFARPFFELGQNTSDGGHHSIRIIGRCLAEPQPFMDDLISQELSPTMARFSQALRRHLPALTPEDFLWRVSFVVGAMHHTLSTLHCMKHRTRGICRDDDYQGALRRFMDFAVATFTTC
jgi:AcrR family transcriptional regulator